MNWISHANFPSQKKKRTLGYLTHSIRWKHHPWEVIRKRFKTHATQNTQKNKIEEIVLLHNFWSHHMRNIIGLPQTLWTKGKFYSTVLLLIIRQIKIKINVATVAHFSSYCRHTCCIVSFYSTDPKWVRQMITKRKKKQKHERLFAFYIVDPL